MSSNEFLQQDIIRDILLRLPVESLARCKCVSKPWHELICDPHFVKTYLKQGFHDHKLIITSPPNSLYSINLSKQPLSNIEDEIPIKLNFEHPNHWLRVLTSCDGLLLLVYDDNTMVLLNPTTLEFKKLPDKSSNMSKCRTIYGIGFDASTNDYKIVTITFPDVENVENNDPENCPEMLVQVYTIRHNCWKQIQNSPFNHSDSWPCSGVFLNGSIHWLATITWSYKWIIAAFDIVTEKFREVPLPDIYADDEGQIDTARLTVLGKCLSLCLYVYHLTVDGNQTYTWDIWMMKEYGVTSSWTKVTINEPDNMFYTLGPVCMLGEHEILMESNGRRLVMYNMEHKSFKDIVICGLPDIFREHVICSESLVSPHCNIWD